MNHRLLRLPFHQEPLIFETQYNVPEFYLSALAAESVGLEADWNDKLRALAETQESYQRERKVDSQVLSESRREQLFSLVKDFLAVWKDPVTPHRERKRKLGLLVEDVTLVKNANISEALTGSLRQTEPLLSRSQWAATESAAILDVCLGLKLIDPRLHKTGRQCSRGLRRF